MLYRWKVTGGGGARQEPVARKTWDGQPEYASTLPVTRPAHRIHLTAVRIERHFLKSLPVLGGRAPAGERPLAMQSKNERVAVMPIADPCQRIFDAPTCVRAPAPSNATGTRRIPWWLFGRC